jgi:rod shape-determining protein MreD
MPVSVRRLLLGVGVFLAQWFVFGRLQVYGAHPDVVLLFLAWYALREGRRKASLVGFVLGLALDAVHGSWGVHMFVKTLVGFLLGLFALDERDPLFIQPQQAFLGGLLVALLHNGLLVALLSLQTKTTNDFLVYALWLGSALYTAIVALLSSLVRP